MHETLKAGHVKHKPMESVPRVSDSGGVCTLGPENLQQFPGDAAAAGCGPL